MGERISIQYTVDVDHLPVEVGRLLEDAFNQYQLLQSECRVEPRTAVLSYEVVEKIDCIRLGLAAIDHRLSDATNIISGYLNYKAQKEVLPSTADEVHELEAKIQEFKDSMVDVVGENEVTD